jgi:HPt (histidine-containing phosphotransfer) domain-containing protein
MTTDKLYNLDQLREIASGNEDFVHKMINMFLDVTPELLNRISAGLQIQDWEEVKSAAHKMKPSLDMMGINSVHTTIRAIEERAKNQTNLEEIPDLYFKLEEILQSVFEQLRAI